MKRHRRAVVFGPAYLDRVVRVDSRLFDARDQPPIDLSVEGTHHEDDVNDAYLRIEDAAGLCLIIEPPGDWPGPRGVITLGAAVARGGARESTARRLHAVSWHDDLGGMGAGYAKALGGTLVCALAPAGEPITDHVERMLAGEAIRHSPIHLPVPRADWTLLISSGPHGDKLPIGLRGCHAALREQDLPHPGALRSAFEPTLLVVAGLPNHLARGILETWSLDDTEAATERHLGLFRFFAPAFRNVADRATPVRVFAPFIDALSCNRLEWEAFGDEDRAAVESHARLVIVTDGPAGATVRFRSGGEGSSLLVLHMPAHPRAAPPRDTNRAGEAFAAAFLEAILSQNLPIDEWDESLLAGAGRRAAAAASLVLDRDRFGFATPEEIDAALSSSTRGVLKDFGSL